MVWVDLWEEVDPSDLSAYLPLTGNGTWKAFYTNGSGTVSELALGAAGTVFTSAGASSIPTFSAGGSLPIDFMSGGLQVTNNATDPTNDFDISAGKARDATDTVDMVLAAGLRKLLDTAWAVGDNAGGLDTGAVADTLYYAWLIKRSDTGVVDVLFSLSATAPTMPANYDYKRRLRGGFYRSGGVNRPIYWFDNETLHFTTSIEDIDDGDIDAEELVAVTCPPNMIVKGRAAIEQDLLKMVFTSPNEAAGTPSTSAVPGASLTSASTGDDSSGEFQVMVDSSSRIQVTPNNTNGIYQWVTYGFIDRRWRQSL